MAFNLIYNLAFINVLFKTVQMQLILMTASWVHISLFHTNTFCRNKLNFKYTSYT